MNFMVPTSTISTLKLCAPSPLTPLFALSPPHPGPSRLPSEPQVPYSTLALFHILFYTVRQTSECRNTIQAMTSLEQNFRKRENTM